MEGEFLSEQEIGERFPGEWVLVEEAELDSELRVVRGRVVSHNQSKSIVEALAQARQGLRSSLPFTVRFAGELPDAVYLLSGRSAR